MEVCNEKEEKYFVWISIGIDEEMGYFRNKLNRIPEAFNGCIFAGELVTLEIS